VVEAIDGSGALSLAAHARRLQRRVFAVPGSIRDPQSRACNQLIRDGATLVQHSSELLEDLNLNNIQSVTEAGTARDGSPPLDNKYEMLLDAAGFEPVDIDVLALRTVGPGTPWHRCCCCSNYRGGSRPSLAAGTAACRKFLSLMTTSVLDILIYVFDRYMLEDTSDVPERDDLARDLELLGSDQRALNVPWTG